MQVSGEHENQARSEQQEVDSDHDGQGLVHRRRADVVGQASQVSTKQQQQPLQGGAGTTGQGSRVGASVLKGNPGLIISA